MTARLLTPEQRERKRAADRAYAQANRDRKRTYDADHYQRNRRHRLAQVSAYRLATGTTSTARTRAWRERHPERARTHRRRWLEEVPLREAAMRAAVTANRRARMYGVHGLISYETVIELWVREPDCVDCGEGRGLDHVIAMSRGGTNTSGNLANRCPSCNNRKGARRAAA